ncbi:MAG: hypothetical protein IJT07_00265 [Oscillospiraceae bacterium]|nr:hypothetical protein [Oscillospiraceae bacterium]
MTAEEFVNQFSMHDSFFESIAIDNNGSISMIVNFAFWMQKNYQMGTPKNGLIEVRFHDVADFSCTQVIHEAIRRKADKGFWEAFNIWSTDLQNGYVVFTIFNDNTDDEYEMHIKADYITIRNVSTQ